MKNTHIEHPEDSILTGDLSALNWFVTDGRLSLKIDGAPAIVWGRNPATGNFFVGTKSVFNKVKIKINESHQDIDDNHTGPVAEILHLCYDYLPRSPWILQGDFIGVGGSDEYQPNTITYVFPSVIRETIIIAPHTYYDAEDDLRNAVGRPLDFSLTDTHHCKFIKPQAWIAYGADKFEDVIDVVGFAKQMSTTCEFVSDKKAREMKKVFNTFIKVGADLDEEALTLACDCDRNLIRLWKLVKAIKDDCLMVCRNNGPTAYMGYDRIDAEGYVYANEFGMFKIVKREAFSRANFNSGRFQTN